MCKSLNERLTRAEQNQADAAQFYRLAVEQGIAAAQSRLGIVYAEGWRPSFAGAGRLKRVHGGRF